MKGKNLQPRILYQQDSPSDLMGEIKNFPDKQKLRESSTTSFTTNVKWTSLGRKHKRRKRPTENKPEAIKKMVIGSYILIITLNVNGLNASTKRHKLARWMKTCTCMHFHLPYHPT